MAKAEFNLGEYRSLIEGFRDAQYRVVNFYDVVPSERHLILRHDIDFSISDAVVMAKLEAEMEVRAHYFVLLRTEMYNPWSLAARDDLQHLNELGHSVGLHFDASLYPEEESALVSAVAAECTALEAIVENPVEYVSFHRPSKPLLGRPGKIAGRSHAYEPQYFNEIGYCSDSRGTWGHGHPFDHSSYAEGSALQLLTHPIWWVGNQVSPQRTLEVFLRIRHGRLGAEVAKNCDVFAPVEAKPDGE